MKTAEPDVAASDLRRHLPPHREAAFRAGKREGCSADLSQWGRRSPRIGRPLFRPSRVQRSVRALMMARALSAARSRSESESAFANRPGLELVLFGRDGPEI